MGDELFIAGKKLEILAIFYPIFYIQDRVFKNPKGFLQDVRSTSRKKPPQIKEIPMGSWSASYITGVPLMDTQHQELFRHMDDLVDKTKTDQIPKIIDYLGEYVDRHFREEQNLHASCGYPQREEHKKLHADFVASYKKLREEYKKSPTNKALMSLKISRTAVEWLKNHIFGPDRMFAKYYFSLPGHAQPKEANLGPNTHQPKRDSFHFSASHPEYTRTENACDSDREVLKRISTRALADELVRRAEMTTHTSFASKEKPSHS